MYSPCARFCRVFCFWVLVCYAATQLATQLQQRRIQMVRSNKVARKRLTESNSTPAMDLTYMNVVLKWCICMLVGLGIVDIYYFSNVFSSSLCLLVCYTATRLALSYCLSFWVFGDPT